MTYIKQHEISSLHYLNDITNFRWYLLWKVCSDLKFWSFFKIFKYIAPTRHQNWKVYANYPRKSIFMLMTSLIMSQHDEKVNLLYTCFNEISTLFMITWRLFRIAQSNCTYVWSPWSCQPWPNSVTWNLGKSAISDCILILKCLIFKCLLCSINKTALPTNSVESPYWCHRFASQIVIIYVKVNIRPLTTFKRVLGNLWQTFVVNHHRCPVPVGLLFFKECWFPQLLHWQCGAFVLIIFSYEPSLCSTNHLKPKWQSRQSISSQ